MTDNTPKTEYGTAPKPPVVVILGHVDHGKTSLLDYIRKSRVAAKESGGITQHVGAYQVTHQDKLITFIDTPGHEAFSAMRSRGADVADMALLIVAADDGVMPQTTEALAHIKQASIPYIVVINKIDITSADPQKIKNQLLEYEVLLEGMGGKVPVVEVSAQTGQGVDDLLEMIGLVWEVEGNEARYGGPAEGVVVESFQNPHRGPSATLLVHEGTLTAKDIVATSTVWGKVRILEDFAGESITDAGPATPALVVGLDDVPGVGEQFVVVASATEAEAHVAEKANKESDANVLEIAEGQKVLNIIVKADAHGTLEAVEEMLRSVSTEAVLVRILDKGVGGITENDVKLAAAGKAIVVGFRVGSNPSAKKLAEQTGVTLQRFDIIYELVQEVRTIALGLVDTETVEVPQGRLKVLAIFRTEHSRMIVGGRVGSGEIARGMLARVIRGEEVIGEGKIGRLQIQERVVERVAKGEEIGVLFEGTARIEEGDTLEIFTHEKKTPTHE